MDGPVFGEQVNILTSGVGGLLWEPKNYHGSALFGRTVLTSQDY